MRLFKEYLHDTQLSNVLALDNHPLRLFTKLHGLLSGGVSTIQKRNELTNSKRLKVYDVSLPPAEKHPNSKLPEKSMILKKCEGARGILYMKASESHPLLPYVIMRKTKILEIKDVSLKIHTYDTIVMSHMVYIENVLGFLKEVD